MQNRRPKASNRAQKEGLRRMGIMATRVADGSVGGQADLWQRQDRDENCATSRRRKWRELSAALLSAEVYRGRLERESLPGCWICSSRSGLGAEALASIRACSGRQSASWDIRAVRGPALIGFSAWRRSQRYELAALGGSGIVEDAALGARARRRPGRRAARLPTPEKTWPYGPGCFHPHGRRPVRGDPGACRC